MTPWHQSMEGIPLITLGHQRMPLINNPRAPMCKCHVNRPWATMCKQYVIKHPRPPMCNRYVNYLTKDTNAWNVLKSNKLDMGYVTQRPLLGIMTSSNGHFFRVTGPLWEESIRHRWIHLTKASDAKLWSFLRSAPEQTSEQAIETPVIWDAIALIVTSL